PPVLAVAVCALQLSFWEHATAASMEILDLLVFAWCLRCLLEFRVSQKENWLFKMAFVYGLGVTNNWAMIGYFPFFLTAVIWIRGLAFFNFSFVTRTVLFGLAGLSLYLLLPIIEAASGTNDVSFWMALKTNLSNQKMFLSYYWSQRFTILLLGVSSLLPVAAMCVRWPSFDGGLNATGEAITRWLFWLLHVSFLGICLWVFFDHLLSPRVKGGGIIPFLTFYYLSAFCVGYFAGFLLVIFGREPLRPVGRPVPLTRLLNRTMLAVLLIATVAVPVALLVRNHPQMRITNGPGLKQFAALTLQSLPDKGAVVLSDNPSQLHLLEATYQFAGRKHENTLLDTASLNFPAYHKTLQSKYPKIQSQFLTLTNVGALDLVQMMERFSLKHPVYYLHPSFGYYFERFYARPHGLVYELKPYPNGVVNAPPMTTEEIAENQRFWMPLQGGTLPRIAQNAPRNNEARVLGAYYSRTINQWGVELQRRNLLKEAGEQFAVALNLNPDNVVSQINLEFNSNLRAGRVVPIIATRDLEKKLGRYGGWEGALNANGPVDELAITLQLGRIFAVGGNLRQSAQLFQRVLDLDPRSADANISMAKTLIQMGNPDRAQQITTQIRANPTQFSLTREEEVELLNAESLTRLARQDFAGGENLLLQARQRDPKDPAIVGLLADYYFRYGKNPTNALAATEQQLQLRPDNVEALWRQGILQMQIGRFDQAAATFTTFLAQRPRNQPATLNRAISFLQTGRLDEAQGDYQALAEELPTPLFSINYGLGEIAYRKKDRAEALKQYEIYLKHAPVETPEYKQVKERMDQLKSGQIL
ncbi:MAG: tetratricopeptide repeat protein, partial [Opitutaceae bacterium]|nr:tetratricopeptide repeat protein [Verrucomicrobiales bacterium]